MTTLEYGDVMWMGVDREGEPVLVGAERKTLDDLVSSLMSGRLSGHQLPGMLDPASGFHYNYLIVEGLSRPDPRTGVLEKFGIWKKPHLSAEEWGLEGREMGGRWYDVGRGTRRFMFSAIDHYLATIETRACVRVAYTLSPRHTAHWIASRYGWWQTKEHKSHLVLDETPDPSILKPQKKEGKYLLRLMLAQVPGLGWDKTKALTEAYPTMKAVREAGVKGVREVEGIGPVLAERVIKAVL